jgi:hypothetical protein
LQRFRDANAYKISLARKKAAPVGAAKFREETPRKGRGIAKRKPAIPRCNNMTLMGGVIKNEAAIAMK